MRKLIIFVLLVGFTIIGLINHDKLDAESNIISNIYCSSCGVESKEKTKFCSNCGEEAIWLTERLELLDETQMKQAKAKKENFTYKYEYIKKMNDLDDDISESRSLYEEKSTSEMIEAEEINFEKWNNMLDDICRLLKTQLSETEFVELKSKQVDWLCYRENTANNDSDNFKGMMFAKVQYNKSLAKLTKERCYELINTYL